MPLELRIEAGGTNVTSRSRISASLSVAGQPLAREMNGPDQVSQVLHPNPTFHQLTPRPTATASTTSPGATTTTTRLPQGQGHEFHLYRQHALDA